MRSEKQIIGDLGEGIVCNYLKNKGFKVIDRNYWKPWGEIDIVVTKRGKIHFIEVKTLRAQISTDNKQINADNNVIRETISGFFKNILRKYDHNKGYFFTRDSKRDEIDKQKDLKKIRKIKDRYRPEDNLHPWKLKRLSRVFQSYLLEKVKNDNTEWQFDIACVYLDVENKVAKVEYMEDIII